MLARTGFKEYEFDYTIKKIEELKGKALVNTIVCLLNNRWKENEMQYLFSLLLNTLHSPNLCKCFHKSGESMRRRKKK